MLLEAMILAALDLGSNSLRLRIAQRLPSGAFETIHDGRIPLRLATDSFGPGRFSDETIAVLAEGVTSFASRMDRFEVEKYCAVGTAAFRAAGNGESALDAIRAACGITVAVLSETEEARLVARAVRATRSDGAGRELVVDLGGGSLDLILIPGGDGEVVSESHSLGLAARFQEFLAERPDDLETRRALWKEAHLISDGLQSQLLDRVPQGSPVALAGGQATMLDGLAHHWEMWDQEDSAGEGITIPQFGALQQKVLDRSAQELADLGVPPDRAPMLAAAGAVYGAVALRVFAGRIRIPRVGLLEGLLCSLPDGGHPWPSDPER